MNHSHSVLGSLFGIIAQAALLLCLSAQPAAAQSSASIYGQLHQLFQSGSIPTENDLVGWRTGRCYHDNQPSTPRNGLMTGWTTAGADHGPISRTQKILRIMPVYWQNGPAGIFDEMSPQVEDAVSRFVAEQGRFVAPARFTDRSVYGSYQNRLEEEWVVRKVVLNPEQPENKIFLTDDKGNNGNSGDGKTQAPTPTPAPNPKAPSAPPVPGRPGQSDEAKDDKEGEQEQKPVEYIVARMTRQGYTFQYCYYFKRVQ